MSLETNAFERQRNTLNILALLLLGTLTGNELAVSAFVHPAISRLPDPTHAASAQSIARVYGRYAPLWYGATLLTLLLTWRTPAHKAELVASVALFVAALAVTPPEVRINNRVMAWNLSDLPVNWKAERAQWDKLHAVRVALLLGALLALIAGTTH